jgi:DNA adenine methylase
MKIVKSPLRYPGSKQKLCKIFSSILESNNVRPKLFIEPFAGGASVSLFMLQNDLTDAIALIEKDPLLASFWKAVFFDSEWLIKKIKKIDVTVDNWKYYKKYQPRTTRNKALKCLFLNRTCFSGILKGGPIGGLEQKSNYKINCRFNKDNLIHIIQTLAEYKNRVAFIEEGDYQNILNKQNHLINNDTFIYFDPPYVKKAKGLYNFYFLDKDHYNLKDYIQTLQINWLLSYDYAPSLTDLYTIFSNTNLINITYTAPTSHARTETKEFVASNLKLDFLSK